MEAFKVPPDLDKVILDFDKAGGQIDLHDVQQSVVAVRKALGKVDDETNNACWAEVLAFSLAVDLPGSCPWGTYFAPVGTFTDEKGNPVYSPDIASTDPKTIEQWQWRASTVSHSVLRARYADLVWDLTTAIASRKPDYEFAKIAIDSYLAAVEKELYQDDYDCFTACERALDIAQSLKDEARIDAARATFLGIHRKVISNGKPLWWRAPDRLLNDKSARTTEEEKQELVNDVEKIVVAKSNIADPKVFDPHQTESAAKLLIGHYRKTGKGDEVTRLRKIIGTAFESAASLAGGMVASSFLQTAVNAYKEAGDKEQVTRARIAMESAIGRAQDEMQSHTFSHEISREDMEKFLDQLIVADQAATMIHLAKEFLPARAVLEQRVKDIAEKAPLSAIITHTVMADDRVTAVIGSVEEDLAGRTVSQAAQEMNFNDVFLNAALERAVEKHSFTPHHFTSWGAQSGLFDDLTLLYQGIDAWFAGDYVKALHVLVPQVEHALRSIAIANGLPATKAHRIISGASVAINMGDILGNAQILAVIGEDLALHFQALYSDPRGVNLRNELAHGLMNPSSLTFGLTCRVIHTLLVLGVWSQIAKSRKARARQAGAVVPAQ